MDEPSTRWFSFYNGGMNSDPMKDRSIPLILFITTIVAYGLLLPQTGFYWDDWPFAWTAKFLGPGEFIPAFQGVRPFLGPIFLATTSLIPAVPLYWQIFALIIRFLSGLSAWFALSQVWPQHKRQVFVASVLFLVFPGYSQHWVAFTHINQEWISLICLLVSIGFMGRGLRNPDMFRSNTAMALVLLALGVFPTEYFIGIGLLHAAFIWVIVHEQVRDPKQRIVRSLRLWLPYFLVWLANVLWLAYFYTVGSYDSYDVEVAKQPVSLMQIVAAVGEALWKVGLYAWGQIVILVVKSVATPSSLLTLLLAALIFTFFVLYLRRFNSENVGFRNLALSAVVIGIAGILLGRLPSFVAGLPLRLQSANDRFTISMMLGGSLFIMGLVELLFPSKPIKNYVFAFLIALAVGQQFFNANIFRRDWANQQEIFSQLAWRIPALEPGTALLTNQLPLDYETDLSLTAPINWMYDPSYTRSDLPYALFYTEKRLGGPSMPSLLPNTEISMGLRRVSFHGSTSQAIVIYMPRGGCLRVLDPSLGDQKTYAREPNHLVDAIPLSNPELILVDVDQTVRLPFLRESEHTWCYYYTKAELARQRNDWQQVIDLYADASSSGYSSADPFEWLVFIEAHAMSDQMDVAQKMSVDAFAMSKRVRPGLCEVWKRVQATAHVQNEVEMDINQMLSRFECAP